MVFANKWITPDMKRIKDSMYGIALLLLLDSCSRKKTFKSSCSLVHQLVIIVLENRVLVF